MMVGKRFGLEEANIILLVCKNIWSNVFRFIIICLFLVKCYEIIADLKKNIYKDV